MILGNKIENIPEFDRNRIKSFNSSIFSSIVLSFKDLYEKFTIKLLEIKYKILKIEKGSIDEQLKESIEINISDLNKKYELYSIRKENYLTYHERKNLIDTCKGCLNTCSSFKSRSKLLDGPSNDFIKNH